MLAIWSSCGRRRLDSVLLRLPNFARLQSSPPPPRKITAYVAFSPSHPPFLHAKYTFTPMHLAIPCCLVVAEFVVYPVFFLPITTYIVSQFSLSFSNLLLPSLLLPIRMGQPARLSPPVVRAARAAATPLSRRLPPPSSVPEVSTNPNACKTHEQTHTHRARRQARKNGRDESETSRGVTSQSVVRRKI